MRAFWICSLALFAALVAISGAPRLPEWKEFVSSEGGYVVHYPPTWRRFPPVNAPTLNVYNFPFSRSGGGVLPNGGASIAVLPAPRGVTTVEQWLQLDQAQVSQSVRRPVALRHDGLVLQAMEVISSVWGDPASGQLERTDCYFEIRQRLFVARLEYRKGDPKAVRYRDTLHGIAETLAPL